MITEALVVGHLSIAAVWLGSMAYSLFAVQPKIASFFADEQLREEFLTVLAHGNRWRVVAMVAVLIVTGGALAALSPAPAALGYAGAVALYAVAAGIFANVSWRHWPARIFALPTELDGYRRRLRRQATAMLGLVGAAFLLALTVSVS